MASGILDRRNGFALGSADGTTNTDVAVSAGATTAEIVDVLIGVIPIVGLPCAVAAAPKLALALGFDAFDADGNLVKDSLKPVLQAYIDAFAVHVAKHHG